MCLSQFTVNGYIVRTWVPCPLNINMWLLRIAKDRTPLPVGDRRLVSITGKTDHLTLVVGCRQHDSQNILYVTGVQSESFFLNEPADYSGFPT